MKNSVQMQFKESIFKITKRLIKVLQSNSYVGVQIKKKRFELGYSQEQLSKQLGIERIRLSNIETGRHQIHIAELEKMCKIFNCTSIDLLGF